MRTSFLALCLTILSFSGYACTNFLITKGASETGSTMISYAADSHTLFGELYFWPRADYSEGTTMKIHEWDTGKYLGEIPQISHTYQVIGNINENQVAIGETTYGGRKELKSQEGAIMDYGSLMYIALQRSKSAREAIYVITDLMEKYGYYSSGESFSIADKNEVWILEMISKGNSEKGAVWVARMIPDGYVSGHANQARILTFPQKESDGSISSKNMEKIYDSNIHTVYAHDVISFARKMGFYNGKDEDFSFSDVYNPLDFGGARFCDARVWAMFRQVNDNMDQYLDYALGHNLSNRMPLWIKPNRKVSVSDMMSFMRDHFEGTKMDMHMDVGAGPFQAPYRWRPLTWKIDDVAYCNERATATQQTGFSFVSECRDWLPDPVGGVLWFGVDDAGTTVYTPVFCGAEKVAKRFERGYGSMIEYKPDAAFWVFNQVSNLAYTRYSNIFPIIHEEQKKLEEQYIASLPIISKAAKQLMDVDPAIGIDYLTRQSQSQLDQTLDTWIELYGFLFIKFVDGNIKKTNGKQFLTNEYTDNIPAYPDQPGYGEDFYRKVIKSTGDHFKVMEDTH